MPTCVRKEQCESGRLRVGARTVTNEISRRFVNHRICSSTWPQIATTTLRIAARDVHFYTMNRRSLAVTLLLALFIVGVQVLNRLWRKIIEHLDKQCAIQRIPGTE